jgi:23S rRNA (guanosine2251-2'-O)-methyltransferase
MYIYGKNVAIETLRNRQPIRKAYIYRNFQDKNIISELQKRNIPIKFVDKFELDKLAKGNHQGIMLSIPDYEYTPLDELLKKENALLVILDHLEDPHNLGAIVRTCEAAGVDGIIIPKNRCVDVNSTVMRTSVGALDYVKIAQVTNLVGTMKELKEKGFWIVGTDMDGTDYQEIDYRGNTAIVIGNEGNGMARLVKENCDFIASIPMNGKVNSLNASVAAGIIIYEAIAKRK